MAKTSAAGSTDQNAPGYFEPGRSENSPNVHDPEETEAKPKPETESVAEHGPEVEGLPVGSTVRSAARGTRNKR